MFKHFSPSDRATALHMLLIELEQDVNVVAAAVVGSGAAGFRDDFSDVDVLAIAANPTQTRSHFERWKAKLVSMFSIIDCYEKSYGKNNFSIVCLLNNYLEIDLGFSDLEHVSLGGKPFRVVFDRIGLLSTALERASLSFGEHTPLPASEMPVWQHVLDVVKAAQRGKMEDWARSLLAVREAARDAAEDCKKLGFEGEEQGNSRSTMDETGTSLLASAVEDYYRYSQQIAEAQDRAELSERLAKLQQMMRSFVRMYNIK